MIEDNIRILRQAARVASSDNPIDDKVWCVIAGNVDLVDNVAYKAIASKNSVKDWTKNLTSSCYMVIQEELKSSAATPRRGAERSSESHITILRRSQT